MTARSGETTATLKFYDAKKGWGFAMSPEGDLHLGRSVALGFEEQLRDGVSLVVLYRSEEKGLTVSKIISIDLDEPSEFYEGEVKFFNLQKGYGFVICDDFQEDLFLHQSIVRQSSLPSLSAEQRVRFTIGDRNGKRQVSHIELLRDVKTSKKRAESTKASSPKSSKKRDSRERYDSEARA